MTDKLKTLRDALEQGRYVWIREGRASFMGYVLGLSEWLVLIHRFRDFAESGYVVIRLDAVGDEVLCEQRSIRFFEQMMRDEGLIESVGIAFEISLHSMAAALNDVRAEGLLVLFDRGPLEDVDSEYHVGEVLEADDVAVRMRHVTAYGEWENRDRALKTSDIERIEFGSPYLKALKKYSRRLLY